MNHILNAIKPSIRAISSYTLEEHDCAVKLNQNESPYDLPQWFKDKVFSEFASIAWNRYPSFSNSKLVGKLAQDLGVEPETLLVGNGSNELLQNVFSVVLTARENLLLPVPTFKVYEKLAAVSQAEIVSCGFEQDWAFPTEKIIDILESKKIPLTVLCSPNSPTGVSLNERDLIRILEATEGLVLVDEAYHEFSGATFLKLQDSYPNLIITRTFSKALGLAGLRIGYLMAHPALIREINKAKLPYNLNVFSEFVATRVLEQKEVIADNIKKILVEKKRLYGALSKLQAVTVYPSDANFFMVQSPAGKTLFEGLMNEGVLVRDISGYHPRLKNHLRITVGTHQENTVLIEALQGLELNKTILSETHEQ